MGIWKILNTDTKQLAKELDEKSKGPKDVKETKCTCGACGNIWYYGKQEDWEQKANALSNFGKSMACCSGCLPSLLIPDKKVVDLDKCPKCGSKTVKKEVITHRV